MAFDVREKQVAPLTEKQIEDFRQMKSVSREVQWLATVDHLRARVAELEAELARAVEHAQHADDSRHCAEARLATLREVERERCRQRLRDIRPDYVSPSGCEAAVVDACIRALGNTDEGE